MALCFDDNKVFFHIPRTGGNYTRGVIRSITKFKHEIGHPHAAPLEIWDRLTDNHETFCIVRHPFDWISSLYKHRIERTKPEDRKKYNFVNFCIDKTFNNFIENILNVQPFGYASRYFSEYIFYVDHILHTENLTQELQQLLHQWGYKKKISNKKVNTTSIRVSISDEIKNKFLQRERGIIKYLGY
jgi:hypothetical protein